jgi:hypothetical protein
MDEGVDDASSATLVLADEKKAVPGALEEEDAAGGGKALTAGAWSCEASAVSGEAGAAQEDELAADEDDSAERLAKGAGAEGELAVTVADVSGNAGTLAAIEANCDFTAGERPSPNLSQTILIIASICTSFRCKIIPLKISPNTQPDTFGICG